MALTVQRPNRVPDFNNTEASPVQQSSRVELKIYNGAFNSNDKTDAGLLAVSDIWLILSEPLTFQIGTSWKDGPGATIAGKINDVMNSSILKILGGDQMFQAIVTDSWSQKVAEKGSPISCKLKTRVYLSNGDNSNNLTASHDYLTLIRFFTRLCAPPKQYSLWSGVLGAITGAARNAKETFQDVKTAATYVSEEDGEEHIDPGKAVKYTLVAAGATFTEPDKAGAGNNATRCQFTLTLETQKFGYSSLDWIVKGFSWTPSQQVSVICDKAHNGMPTPYPLWVDFDIDLETNICPSNAYVSKLFSKSTTSIHTGK